MKNCVKYKLLENAIAFWKFRHSAKKNMKVNWISRKKKEKKFHTKKIDFLQSCVFVQLQMHTPIVVGYGLNEYVVVSNSRSGKKVNFQCGSLHTMLGIYQATSILHSKISFG